MKKRHKLTLGFAMITAINVLVTAAFDLSEERLVVADSNIKAGWCLVEDNPPDATCPEINNVIGCGIGTYEQEYLFCEERTIKIPAVRDADKDEPGKEYKAPATRSCGNYGIRRLCTRKQVDGVTALVYEWTTIEEDAFCINLSGWTLSGPDCVGDGEGGV